MIKIIIKESVTSDPDSINNIEISGHSGYKEMGSDIVCASVSSICITTVNAIINVDNKAIKYQDSDGYLNISIIKHSDTVDKLILNMINLLEELEKQYKNYIEIRRCQI